MNSTFCGKSNTFFVIVVYFWHFFSRLHAIFLFLSPKFAYFNSFKDVFSLVMFLM